MLDKTSEKSENRVRRIIYVGRVSILAKVDTMGNIVIKEVFKVYLSMG